VSVSSALWVAAPDYLPWLVLVGLPVVGVQATVVAAKSVNVLVSGRSAAGPGTGSGFHEGAGASPQAAASSWVTGPTVLITDGGQSERAIPRRPCTAPVDRSGAAGDPSPQ
jgi:hypothetical protein